MNKSTLTGSKVVSFLVTALMMLFVQPGRSASITSADDIDDNEFKCRINCGIKSPNSYRMMRRHDNIDKTIIDEPAVLQSAAVSGTIRHAGNPVANIQVEVHWDSSSDLLTTDSSGVYSTSGVPTGGWLEIRVRPPVNLRLAYHNWRTEELTADLVKDFDLEDGFRLSGEYRQPDGSPHTVIHSVQILPIGFSPPDGEYYGPAIDANGQFDVVLPDGFYALVATAELSPLFMPNTIIDMRSGDDLNRVVMLLHRPELFPTSPPRSDLITIGSPDPDGFATVTGSAGAVPPLAAVAISNLSAYSVATVGSDTVGAFTTTLYAPPGSSLLIKYDLGGDRVAMLWHDAQFGSPASSAGQPDVADFVEYMNPLPGTMMYVGGLPPGDNHSQAFDSIGSFTTTNPKGWAGWWLSGVIQVPASGSGGLTVLPGEPVTITTDLHVTSPGLNCTNPLTYTVVAIARLHYRFNENGRVEPGTSGFQSHLFTPTGIPIEHGSGGETVELGTRSFENFTCSGPDTFESTLVITGNVPSDLPEGIYLPHVQLIGVDIPLSDDQPLIKSWYHVPYLAYLPPLTLGSPAPPRIPWTLLVDYSVNGHRGVQACEDVGHYQMSTWLVYPPEHVIIPPLDEHTLEPLSYRLEPGSNWLSLTDRRFPNPLQVPLAFPSGHLIVEVLKPDGSVDILGTVADPILQSSIRTPTTPGGALLDESTGNVGDIYHLTTLSDDFAYNFDQYGDYMIAIFGQVDDVYGNPYIIQSTYDVKVARVLDLDPAQLPTTPYMQGDAFAPGLHIFPQVPADLTVRLVQMPLSEPTQAITTTITGQANRFGYFQPPAGTEILLEAPGEFRVDILAEYLAPDGTLWAGAMTWGNVVEGPNALIEAHGRRGMDYNSNTIDDMPAWFIVDDLPAEKVGIEVYYPYFSGDIHWGREDRQPGDSIQPTVTLKDLTGTSETIYNLMRSHFPRTQHEIRWPPDPYLPDALEKRLKVHEAPLFMTTMSGKDPGVIPQEIDLWGYWYGSSERPDVRVREVVSQDGLGVGYWRFNDTYGYQIGEPADGDQPGDIKWEFGGVVFRTITDTNPLNEYAIYSSLWVLLPHGDLIGPRVTPPFQDATGASINGGPIMTLQGEEIDMLFLPKGVRPGDILELGDVVSFSGHVGPPLDSRVAVTITAPSGTQRVGEWHANKIGWIYDPSFDFNANEVGRWTVEAFVEHDRPYLPANAPPPQDHNTGTVLGTQGQYEFYVVEPGSPELGIITPNPGFIIWPNYEIEPIRIQGVVPEGTTTVYYTIHDKGVVMGQGMLTPDALGRFTLVYDPETLHDTFSMLSLTAHEGRWEGLADEVAINFLAVGSEGVQAAAVTLIGEEVFLRNTASVFGQFLPVITR